MPPLPENPELGDDNAVGVIQVKLRDVNQLFNSIDPSPFYDKDLDKDAQEFIVSWARQYGPREPLRLVIHLDAVGARDADPVVIENAVQNYFVYRACQSQRDFSVLMRQGRTSLGIGVLFLAGCILIGEILSGLGENPAYRIVRESLLIGGWVAMWRPLEIFLYDWWPVRNTSRLCERLSRMPVEIRIVTGDAAGAATGSATRTNGSLAERKA